MKKNYLFKPTVYLFVILSLIMMSTAAYAKTYYRTGECGPKAVYEVTTDGKLVISGTGKLYDYSLSSDTPWYGWRDSILSIEISNGITIIGEMSFGYQQYARSVSLPSTITKIKRWAFYECALLSELHIPEGCTSLEGNTFGSFLLFISCGIHRPLANLFKFSNLLRWISTEQRPVG